MSATPSPTTAANQLLQRGDVNEYNQGEEGGLYDHVLQWEIGKISLRKILPLLGNGSPLTA